jgi:hypothetical protein
VRQSGRVVAAVVGCCDGGGCYGFGGGGVVGLAGFDGLLGLVLNRAGLVSASFGALSVVLIKK